MNQILQKCLNELSSVEPRIDYVRGMLETLLEMQPQSLPIGAPIMTNQYNPGNIRLTSTDLEGAMLDNLARIKMDSMGPIQEL